ncbi:MAG: T9SS type A sorting domain-containing protein, partial [Bacteroidota bacterium]
FGATTNWSDCWTNFAPESEDYNAGPYLKAAAVASFNASENDKVVTFTNGSLGNNMKFMWDFGVSASTSDTSTLQSPTYTYSDTGVYTVRLTVMSPCGDSTITQSVHVQGSVGLKEVENVGSVKIYPNPARNVANVEFELIESTSVTITMYDLSGREVKVVPSQFMMSGSNTIHIETSDLNAGMYFTRISTDRSEKTYRLIIIK